MDNTATPLQQSFIKPTLHEKYKNVIFDVGAVLVSWNPDEILKNTFGDKFVSVESHFDIFKSDVWSNLDRGTITHDQAVNLLSQHLGIVGATKIIEFGINSLNPLQAGIKIFNEIKACGYKTYILSNMSELALQKIATENDFVKQVDGAIWSYKVKCIKPEPEIYQALLREYSLNAEECIFIDDRDENIKAAQALGIDGIVCKDHDFVWQELRRLKII
jgi:putative hydrolase of the HAD superfamily